MDVRNGRSLSMDSVKFKLGKTSKFQILNILFWTMDLKFLESVIIDYLIWVESYTVYVVWIHNIAHQAKKMLLRVWKDMKSIKLHVKVLHLIRSSQIEYKVMKVKNCVCCVFFCCQFLKLNNLGVWNKFWFFVDTVKF